MQKQRFELHEHDFLPSGVKKTMDEMRNPRMSPTTNTQAMTEPNRHQLITMATPPTTPISAVRANRTAERRPVNKPLIREQDMHLMTN